MKKILIISATALLLGSCMSRSKAKLAEKSITKPKTEKKVTKRGIDKMAALDKRVKRLEASRQKWALESYQYVITLQDSFWIEVRRADGTLVKQIWCDTASALGKAFYNDNL